MAVVLYQGKSPVIHENSWVADDAKIIGNVEIGENSSVWFNTVVRGDINAIRIGRYVNIQDGAIVHVGPSPEHFTTVGDYVSVGHNATLHGCKIHNEVLIGIGAIILNGAVVESQSIVAAGALVRVGDRVPGGVLFAGVPGKIVRDLSAAEIKGLREHPEGYWDIAASYRISS
jgi:carbonic anhydrase/acetyltransferase-like protein (isoleucine patch superfamily)